MLATNRDGAGSVQILSQEEIDEKAWKYTGYRNFARFVASDPDFFVLRRFDTLHARSLLTLQDHLSSLEERLEDLDSKYSRREAGDINNGSIRNDQPDRAALLIKIAVKLREYGQSPIDAESPLVLNALDELLRAYSRLRDRPRAPKRSIANVENWFYNNDGAIAEEERQSVAHKEDLISIEVCPKPTMRQFLERHIIFRMHWLWRKEDPVSLRPWDKDVRTYVSDDQIDLYSTIAVFVGGLFMLIAPIWILNILHQPYVKLGLITTFIMLFLTTVYHGTVARPAETLAATAAYSAVLMVFLQLGHTSS